MTFILGLTGSIGMGKSATSAMFRAAGVPVHDADASVHALYRGAAVQPVGAAFSGVVVDGAVDRGRLAAMVLNDPLRLRQLESIVHPLVRQAEQDFVVAAASHRIAVLDVPLLLETGGDRRCDAVVVVSAAEDVQRARVLGRAGMTESKFAAILAKQMPDAEKRRRAHFIVETDHGFPHAEGEVWAILTALAARPGRIARRPDGGRP